MFVCPLPSFTFCDILTLSHSYYPSLQVFKYKVLEIEKANYMVGGYEQYFMTVKVLNLTIGTSIETFHINVARRIPDRFEEVLSCNPKGMVKH